MYTSERNEVEVYSPAGKFLSVTDRTGYTQVLTYDSGGRPTQVQDSFGRSLLFTYAAISTMTGPAFTVAGMVDPQGGQYSHITNTVNSLVESSRIVYPDGKSRTYVYNEIGAYPLDSLIQAGEYALNGSVSAMTGLLDENGQRYGSWFYDSKGRAISSEHAGGVDKVSLTYNADGSTQVTNARGVSHLNTFTTTAGNVLLTGKTQPAGSGCMASARNLMYDGAGNVAVRDNFNGERTCSVYDNKNQEVLKVEGLAASVDCSMVTPIGAPLPSGARRVTTAWHPDWHLPVQVSEPLLVTTSVYHGQPDPFNGNATASCTPATSLPNGKPVAVLCKRVKQALLGSGNVDSSVPLNVETFTYDSLGNQLSGTDPLGRTTTHTYYASTSFTGVDPNAVGYTLGDLQSTTNAAGQVTQYPLYDKSGRVKQMIDPKGVVTDIGYTPRGWVSTVTMTAPGGAQRATTYTYDGVGQLTGLSQPDGSTLSYSYDAAHRLVGVTDAKGNSVTYTLDNTGNRVGEEIKDSTGTLQRTIGRSFDALNRVQQVTGAQR
jgi:YD repeat-containing protein